MINKSDDSSDMSCMQPDHQGNKDWMQERFVWPKLLARVKQHCLKFYVRGISQVWLFPNHQPSDTTTPQGSSNKNSGNNQTMNCHTWTIKIVHTVTYSAHNKVVSNDIVS